MSSPLRVVVAAGGTGGHLFPALAVAEALADRVPSSVEFVGTGRELEQKIVGGAGYTVHALSLRPVTGHGGLGILRMIGLLPVRLVQAVSLLRRIRPAVVIGFGGYPSVLPIVAAWVLRIPRIIHEQNAEVGLANRFLSLFANRIFAAPGAKGFWGARDAEVTHFNNPVRRALSAIPEWAPPAMGEPLRLLVLGGSQGAASVNTAVVRALPALPAASFVIQHQTGAADRERIATEYAKTPAIHAEVDAFVEDMGSAYSRAHLIVSRAGAMSAAEIAEAGRPAIFVPLPIARSHQRHNVRFLEEAGAAVVVEQGEGFEPRLAAELRALASDPERLASMAAAGRRAARSGDARSAAVFADAVIELGRDPKEKTR